VTGTLHGRSFSEWSKINDVLENHCIGNAKALENALKEPERRVAVRDWRNHDRVLGTLPRLELASGMRHYRMAIMPRPFVAPYGHEPMLPARSTSVEFIVEFDHYSQDGCYLTRAALDLLLCIDTFRLPGESAAQAKERHYRQG